MKTFKFSLVLRTRENTDVFITLDDNIYGIHSKRVNILYLFFCCEYHKYCHRVKWKHQYFHECEARVKIWMLSLHEMKIFMVFTEKE